MRNLLKLKKNKIAIYLFLIFNQIVFSANAFNFGKLDLINQKRNIFQKKNNDEIYISSVNKTNDYEGSLIKEAKELEKFVDETFGPNDFENLIDLNNKPPKETSNTKL